MDARELTTRLFPVPQHCGEINYFHRSPVQRPVLLICTVIYSLPSAHLPFWFYHSYGFLKHLQHDQLQLDLHPPSDSILLSYSLPIDITSAIHNSYILYLVGLNHCDIEISSFQLQQAGESNPISVQLPDTLPVKKFLVIWNDPQVPERLSNQS